MADNRDIIRERILSEISDLYDKNPGTFLWELAQAEAIELEGKYLNLEDALNQKFAGTADIENLKVIAFEKGVNWKDSTKASGNVNVTGNPGAIINIGDLFSSSLNQYQATEQKTLDINGTAIVPVECTIGGIAGNTITNTIISFPKTLAGINTVTNPQAFTNGFEAETREELLYRYYETIRKPATSGNPYHYEQWALSVEGVGGVKVKPIWNGGGTVKVVIIDRNKLPASTDLINTTKAFIETVRPIGADVTVVGPAEKVININTKITLRDGFTLQQSKDDIQSKITDHFKELSLKQFKVYYATIGNIIFNAVGVSNLDYSTFTLNGTNTDITLQDTNATTEVPKIGTLTVTL